jgi:hypothetical protein
MGNVVVGYHPRSTGSDPSVGSGSGGGNVDDILKRLGNVEISVSEVKSQVSTILGIIPHLATKADVADVRTAVGAIAAVMPQFATKADVIAVKADVIAVKADVAAVETAIIKWIIATTLATAALAFAIAKFVH